MPVSSHNRRSILLNICSLSPLYFTLLKLQYTATKSDRCKKEKKRGSNAIIRERKNEVDPEREKDFLGKRTKNNWKDFRLFYKHLTVNKLFYNSRRWLDSNPGPLVPEAGVQSTVEHATTTAQTSYNLTHLFQMFQVIYWIKEDENHFALVW